MADVNRSFVSMMDLLDRTGAILAEKVGAEVARVTPGASAAIAMGTAACLTGMDGAKWEQLGHDRDVQARVRDPARASLQIRPLRAVVRGQAGGGGWPGRHEPGRAAAVAVGAKTAHILHPAHLDGTPGTLGLAEVSRIARAKGVPVFVDAAYSNDPPERMRTFIAGGADLVCFSAKYFGGPNAGGFIAGRADLMAAVTGDRLHALRVGQVPEVRPRLQARPPDRGGGRVRPRGVVRHGPCREVGRLQDEGGGGGRGPRRGSRNRRRGRVVHDGRAARRAAAHELPRRGFSGPPAIARPRTSPGSSRTVSRASSAWSRADGWCLRSMR